MFLEKVEAQAMKKPDQKHNSAITERGEATNCFTASFFGQIFSLLSQGENLPLQHLPSLSSLPNCTLVVRALSKRLNVCDKKLHLQKPLRFLLVGSSEKKSMKRGE